MLSASRLRLQFELFWLAGLNSLPPQSTHYLPTTPVRTLSTHWVRTPHDTAGLPLPFRREINLVLAYRVLAQCPLFANCDLGFMYAVAGALQLQLYAPVDYLCAKGEIGRELFFIHRGTAEVMVPGLETGRCDSSPAIT